MNKILPLILLLGGFCQLTHAQLTGDYSVGPSGADYATIGEAVDHLKTDGISGDVQLLLQDGEYEEQLIIPFITGMDAHSLTLSAANSEDPDVVLTFTGNTATDSNAVVILDSVSNFKVNELVIESPSGRNGVLIHNGITNFTVTNTSFKSAGSGSAIYSKDFVCDSITVMKSTFENGTNGLYIYGEGFSGVVNNITIEDNDFSSCTNAVNGRYLGEFNFTGNELKSSSITLSYSNSAYLIANNWLLNSNIHFTNFSGSGGQWGILANNVITISGKDALYLSNAQRGYMYHNSVSVYGSNTGAHAIETAGANAQNWQIKNNIFKTESAALFKLNSGATDDIHLYEIDGNLSYTDGSTFAIWDGVNYDVTQWTNATSATNEQNVDPGFISPTNPLFCSEPSFNKVAQITMITEDINGDARGSMTLPGADEYSMLHLNVNAYQTVDVCPSAGTYIWAEAPVASGNILWLNSDIEIMEEHLIKAHPETQTYYIATWTDGTCEITDSVLVTVLATAPTNPMVDLQEEEFCLDNVGTIEAISTVGTVFWYLNGDYDDIHETGATLHPTNEVSETTYYVAAFNDDCYSYSDSILITVDPCLGFTETSNEKVAIYPLPVRQELHIDTDENVSNIRVSNARGEEINTAISGKTVTLDNAPSGIYILSFEIAGELFREKIMVQ